VLESERTFKLNFKVMMCSIGNKRVSLNVLLRGGGAVT